jgi:hypothetical protein
VVEGRSLISSPNAEVEYNVGTEAQGAKSQPNQSALKDVSLPACERLAELPLGQVSEQRDHPLVRRQAQGIAVSLDLFGARRLA